ncbi:fibroblast growth factor 19 [Bombina bombina]|uniref:fibroblast growth factor 19 n=1 Tax=Bombina bombina TaxID=8345 RepID=UPI00235A47FE|nr:fibroblast growth factor 19 [Bombina bombina]
MWRRLKQTVFSFIPFNPILCPGGSHYALFDARPHVQDWGESIRLRHLYTARKQGQESFFLRIHNDGRVDGDRQQSSQSLLEIRAVAVGIVAFKGYHSSLYLCMDADGKLYGMDKYSPEDCSFKEELLPDGYNMYKSHKHGIAVSLIKDKQRQQNRGKGFLPLSHFLPVRNWFPLDDISSPDEKDYEYPHQFKEKIAPFIDTMDVFGLEDLASYNK